MEVSTGLPSAEACSGEAWTSGDDARSARAKRNRTLMHGKAEGHETQCYKQIIHLQV